jgi:hypothetical protein
MKDLSQRVLARLSLNEMKRISEEVEVDMETMEKILLELEKAARVS